VNAELNDWYAFVCDGTNPGASCNATFTVGNGTTSSPFVVNHRPTFTVIFDSSPVNPGSLVTWYSTATDQDTGGGQATNTVQLFICKANDFTGTSCGAGGQWANSSSSAVATNTNPFATTTIGSPFPDAAYPAFAFVIDNHNFPATGGVQAANTGLDVNNMTPTIAGASVSLLDTDESGNLTLTTMATQTLGFKVRYTVSDQNSCVTASSTNEIIFGTTNVYRANITQAGCDQTSEYNANYCYAGGVSTNLWNKSCVASSTSCTGVNDSDVVWDCTFPLWFIADATDGAGGPVDPPNWSTFWTASVQGADNNFATTSLVEAASGTDMTSFLAYNISTTTIVYGGLQPGQTVDPIGPNSNMRVDLQSVGNVGLDQILYGTDMCPGYPACSGLPQSTIFPVSQKYATSSVGYTDPATFSLLVNPGIELELNVTKTKATGTISASTTYWGINVPLAITLSGDYIGENTLIGVVGESASW
jgi:hypothetical protein